MSCLTQQEGRLGSSVCLCACYWEEVFCSLVVFFFFPRGRETKTCKSSGLADVCCCFLCKAPRRCKYVQEVEVLYIFFFGPFI